MRASIPFVAAALAAVGSAALSTNSAHAQERSWRLGAWSLHETRDAFSDQVRRIAVLQFNDRESMALRCFGDRPSVALSSPIISSYGVDEVMPLSYRLNKAPPVEARASSFGDGTAQIGEDWVLLIGLKRTDRIAMRLVSKNGATSDLTAAPDNIRKVFVAVMGGCMGTIRAALSNPGSSSQGKLTDLLLDSEDEPQRPGRVAQPIPREDYAIAPLDLSKVASERAGFKSQAGWSLAYSSDLLYLAPDATDRFDRSKQSFNTVWHSNRHGNDVVIYVQVSPNQHCRNAFEYARDQIAPKRLQVAGLRDVGDPDGVRRSAILEGRGFVSGQRMRDLATIDFVTHRRDDPSTLVHVGGRFPPSTAATYRAEIMKMLDSMDLPRNDRFRRICG